MLPSNSVRRSPSRGAVAALLLLWLCAPGGAAALPGDTPWELARSGPVSVWAEGSGGWAAQLAADLHCRFLLLEAATGLDLAPEQPFHVFWFADGVSGEPYGAGPGQVRMRAASHLWAAVGSGPPSELDDSLALAWAGELVQRSPILLPAWLAAGLEQLVAQVDVTAGDGRCRIHLDRPPGYLEVLREQDWMSLYQFPETGFDSLDPGLRSRLSIQMWGLIHYLAVAEDHGIDRLRRYVGRLADGEVAVLAFGETFGGGYDDVLVDARALLAREKKLAKLPGVVELPAPAAPEASVVARTDLLAELGRLLAARGRSVAANAHLDAALEQDPGHATALLGRRELEAGTETAPTTAEVEAAGPLHVGGVRLVAAPEEIDHVEALVAAGRHAEALAELERIRGTIEEPARVGALETRIAELRAAVAVDELNRAVALINDQGWSEAIVLLRTVLGAEDLREEHRARARELLDTARNLEQMYVTFPEAYNRAVDLIRQKRWADAESVLVSLAAETSDPDRRGQVEILLSRVRERLAEDG